MYDVPVDKNLELIDDCGVMATCCSDVCGWFFVFYNL